MEKLYYQIQPAESSYDPSITIINVCRKSYFDKYDCLDDRGDAPIEYALDKIGVNETMESVFEFDNRKLTIDKIKREMFKQGYEMIEHHMFDDDVFIADDNYNDDDDYDDYEDDEDDDDYDDDDYDNYGQ